MKSCLPECCINIILDYHAQLEHNELFTDCMVELRSRHFLRMYNRMIDYYYILNPIMHTLQLDHLNNL